MKTEIKQITPQMAKELLRNNKNNRRLKKDWINELVHLIKNDQWKLTHQGIAISETGNLLDGQNRLTAIAKGTKTVPMMVTTGLPEGIMSVIDIGSKRSIGDVFGILNVKNATAIGAIMAKYFRVRVGNSFMRSGNSQGDIKSFDEKYQFYLANEKLIEKLHQLSIKCWGKFRFYTGSEIAAISLYLILDKGHSYSKVSEFWLQVHMLSDSQPTMACKSLTNMLLKYLTGSEKIKPKFREAVTIKAWNYYLNSADVKRLVYTSKDEMPVYQ